MKAQKVKHPAYYDKYLMENTLELVEKFNIDTIYETGTCTGGSTLLLGNKLPTVNIFSYEINKENYDIAVEACKGNKNVSIKNISSVDGLINDVTPENKNALFFLDAHWGNYWPLKDELKVICDKGLTPVIIIHDFFVPSPEGKAKFGFDTYKGQPLNFNYIKDSIETIYNKKYEYFYSDKVVLNSGVIYINKETV